MPNKVHKLSLLCRFCPIVGPICAFWSSPRYEIILLKVRYLLRWLISSSISESSRCGCHRRFQAIEGPCGTAQSTYKITRPRMASWKSGAHDPSDLPIHLNSWDNGTSFASAREVFKLSTYDTHYSMASASSIGLRNRPSRDIQVVTSAYWQVRTSTQRLSLAYLVPSLICISFHCHIMMNKYCQPPHNDRRFDFPLHMPVLAW